MRPYFGLTAIALIIAGLCGAPLSWDGSYYLFKILDTQAPFVQYNRLSVLPLHYLVLLANRFTGDVSIPQTVFGLLYAGIPLLALALSWWVVRDRAQQLFFWAALGICLGTLPGQFYFTTEGIPAIQLSWPIVLGVLVGVPRSKAPIIVLAMIAVFFAHPVAAALFALCGVLSCLSGLASRDARRHMLLWALGFGGLSILRLSLIEAGYETDQFAPSVLSRHFSDALAGAPLSSLVLIYLVALIAFAEPFIKGGTYRMLWLPAGAVGLACLIIAGWLLVGWARDPQQWGGAVGFRSWALFCSAPFFGLAALEGLLGETRLKATLAGSWSYRSPLLNVVALIFLLVLGVQSRAWLNLRGKLRETLSQSSSVCTSQASIPWLDRTPLNHWATPSYAVVLQGRVPSSLVLEGEGCTEARLSGLIRIAPWDTRTAAGGWFDLGPVLAKQERSRPCWFVMGPAWYAGEQNGTDWWRWTDKDGKVRAFVEKRTPVVVAGQVRSIRGPAGLEVLINGHRRTTLELTQDQFQPFGPLSLELEPGENVIELLTEDSSASPSLNPEPGVAVKNMTITTDSGSTPCELQP